MTESNKRYRERTIDVLCECSKWLDDHAEELATKFAGDEIGCQSWSLSFTFDVNGFPGVIVNTENKCIATVANTITSTEYY